MPRETGGPSPDEMDMRMGSEYQRPENEQVVRNTLNLAGQLKGNKLRPELVGALLSARDLGDPVVLDKLDPDSETNQKYLSQEVRDNLRRAWDALESKTDTPRNGIAA